MTESFQDHSPPPAITAIHFLEGNTQMINLSFRRNEVPMHFKHMYIRLEIAFWEIAILLLEDSRRLQRTLCTAHKIYEANPWIGRIPKPALWIVSGLTLGILLGAIAASLTP